MEKDPAGYSDGPPPSYSEYAHQQPMMQQPQQPMMQQPIMQQPQVIVQPHPTQFKQYPLVMQCPHCASTISTKIDRKIGLVPWLACGSICLFGFWCGCCLIPFCIDSLKDAVHYCPNCQQVVGHFKHI